MGSRRSSVRHMVPSWLLGRIPNTSSQWQLKTLSLAYGSRVFGYFQRHNKSSSTLSEASCMAGDCRILKTAVAEWKCKVKVTPVQALRLCTGRTAHRGSRGIALPFHDHGTRMGWEVSVTPRPLFAPGKDPVPIVQEAGWAPGSVWTGAENLAPHRDSIPGPSSP